MSWMQRLYETYESNKQIAGITEADDYLPLLPLYHTFSRPHVEVTLDGNGNLLRARLLDKQQKQIIIPVTEDSSGRTGKAPSPHPLVDKVQYLAGDYADYGGRKYFGYEPYLKNLTSWAKSPYGNEKIKAIQTYVFKGTLIHDLVEHQVMELDPSKRLLDKWDKDRFTNAPVIFMDEAVVQWCVEIPGVKESRTWEDPEVHQSWIDYYGSIQKNIGFCQILGKDMPLAEKHPKNIYNLCANAKIISSNDESGFTYRGRFTDSNQAYGVSVEASQKAHHALRWLIDKQGHNKNKRSILLWSTKGTPVAGVFSNTLDLFNGGLFGEEDLYTEYTGEDLAHKLQVKLSGYSAKLDLGDNIVVMILDSATDGRLSITYYQEMSHARFIELIESWHETCKWKHRFGVRKSRTGNHLKQEAAYIEFLGAPAPVDIAKVIYGDTNHLDDDLIEKTIERILACIIEGRKIPFDIVDMAYHRAIKREAYDETWRYDKTLSVACALYVKYLYDYKKEVVGMALDPARSNRDYLYGRLLAVAENVEHWALKKRGENRATNAERLMHRFADHPFSTWKTIELSLRPYYERLHGQGKKREWLIDEIMDLFDPQEFTNDSKLSGEFLLGYHNQREALWLKANDKDVQEGTENGGLNDVE